MNDAADFGARSIAHATTHLLDALDPYDVRVDLDVAAERGAVYLPPDTPDCLIDELKRLWPSFVAIVTAEQIVRNLAHHPPPSKGTT